MTLPHLGSLAWPFEVRITSKRQMRQLSELLAGLEVIESSGPLGIPVAGLAYDSRQVEAGYLFAALPGTRSDGHRYLGQALERGATAVLIRPEGKALVPASGQATALVVGDARVALAQVSAAFYGYPSRSLRIIGVTGTNGKTTITYLVEAILRGADRRTGVIGTLAYRIGEQTIAAKHTTPEAPDLQAVLAQMVEAKVGDVAMEVSSHALAQHRADFTEIEVAVFTNLTRDHLDYHANVDEYLQAKRRLFIAPELQPTRHPRVNVVNADDPASDQLVQGTQAPLVRYGLSEGAEIRATDVEVSVTGTSFALITPTGRYGVRLQLLGRFNVYNALAALAVAYAQGLDLPRAIGALEAVAPISGRFQRVGDGRRCTVVVDYAHSPDGLEQALFTAREMTRGRVIAVFGCGGDRDTGKRPLMGGIAARLADLCVITSDNPRSEPPEQIIEQIWEGVPEEQRSRCLREPDRRRAIEQAIDRAGPDDVVVIAGKGHENYQIFADRTIHFDDREVAEQALSSQGVGR